MLGRPMTRLTEELGKIDASLRRRPATEIGPEERGIVRWMDKDLAAARRVRAEIIRDGTGRAIELEMSCPVKEGEHPTLAKGAYLLRTNCAETDPAKPWRWSMQLTRARAAFWTAKGDMGRRLAHLGPRLPGGLRLVGNVVEKTGC